MAKVTFTENDPFIITIRDEVETADLFGDDFIDEYGIEVPDELIERFKNNYKEFKAIQQELDKYRKSN